MIGHIEGLVDSVDKDLLVVDCGGVGYEVLSTGTVIFNAKKGQKIKVLTYMVVREDSMQLFGFHSKEERSLFKQLLSVSGIGPKGAMSIVSAFDVKKLIIAITKGDVETITSVPGIGRKTAQKVIIELKEKLAKAYSVAAEDQLPGVSADNEAMKDAISALMALGYNAKEARAAISSSGVDASTSGVEAIIKASLKNLF